MTKFLLPSFSVRMAGDQQYRDNWDACFAKKEEPMPELTEEEMKAEGLERAPDSNTPEGWSYRPTREDEILPLLYDEEANKPPTEQPKVETRGGIADAIREERAVLARDVLKKLVLNMSDEDRRLQRATFAYGNLALMRKYDNATPEELEALWQLCLKTAAETDE